MMILNPERYQQLISEAEEAHFSGWDFNWLNDRMIQEDPPWDYPAIVKSHFEHVRTLLDMGTGGGELLASLSPLPTETHATESYPPNQSLAEKQLAPLNVTVHRTEETAPLPFDNHYFDFVINRHESFNAAEVFRVLKPGSKFITQQVGGLNNLELNQVLEDAVSFPYVKYSLTEAFTELINAGFKIERAEQAALTTIFKDIGAVVYYLKAISWQVPDFNAKTHAVGLKEIDNVIETLGHFSTTAHRFLLIAYKELQ